MCGCVDDKGTSICSSNSSCGFSCGTVVVRPGQCGSDDVVGVVGESLLIAQTSDAR